MRKWERMGELGGGVRCEVGCRSLGDGIMVGLVGGLMSA